MSAIDKFGKKWSPQETESIVDKVKARISPPPPVRYRITMALFKIKVQKNRLEYTLNKLQERANSLFEKVVDAQVKKDADRAALYASEVAEVRKVAKTILSSIFALERIGLRLETVRDVGDLVSAMGPVVGVVKEVKQNLMGIMPEVAFELGEVDEILQGTVTELGEFTGVEMNNIYVTDEARKVMEEASAIAEQRMKEQFPELPSGSVNLPAPPSANTNK
jgi:division protein CdvB (Snf7/Vps24/ESCRT-III family)